ncbi:methylamine dehydrogenase light chain [Acetobacter oeni]|uniref:Methylamine dehydrogenase (amicyanin) n=1 Tax=Acetobacter oeni TaxID=304077 RepID=A0A511XM61_9PROT|nr:methylamine dehydrogenase light chain [Acetobacter oeni]MBB3884046.1 methylamine dehydrogenase light chain [Acetobacter oeni]NHO20009.1 methylamine dehydrogenase (amicyanin) light chain [Acetobacter oeni]GEN64033.1 hypothetical protein AOE01nite_22570 [Acetobacter oeni]
MTSRSVFDQFSERVTRGLARFSSRRSVLGAMGTAAVAQAFPLLPVARAAETSLTEFELKAQTKDPLRCDYWRHCAIDGVLCGCCGGGIHSCPPGSQPSPVSWIGTCRNPDDGKSYVIAYRDCCGRTTCQAPESCDCNTADRELPIYRPQNSNDIIWCFGTASQRYHCSTAALIGSAD